MDGGGTFLARIVEEVAHDSVSFASAGLSVGDVVGFGVTNENAEVSLAGKLSSLFDFYGDIRCTPLY